MGFNYRSVSYPAINKSINEDSVGVFAISDGLLIIVCDGVNSALAGQLSIETVFNFFKTSTEPDYLVRIRESIYSANNAILNYAKSNHINHGLATTADVLFLLDQSAYWGHIGDSRIYNLKNNNLHRITKDHSVIQKLVDEGFLTMTQAFNHPGKSAIFGALGGGNQINIDLSKMHLTNYDHHKFFVCTDGVSNIISEEKIENTLRLRNIDSITKELEKLILACNPKDDFSFVVVEYS